MTRQIVGLALVSLIAAAVVWAQEAASRPSLAPTKATAAPKIDGSLDDPAWQSAATFTDFKHPDGSAAKGKAQLRLAQDDKALYIAVECFEDAKTLQSLVADVKTHDGENIWSDDSVELFLAPAGKSGAYYQIAINSRGVTWDAYHAEPNNPDISWNSHYECAAKVGTDRWTVELALPWSAFDATPKFADAWGFNVMVNRQAADESLWLSPYRGSAHQPERFATLTGIIGQAPADAKPRQPLPRPGPPDPTTQPWFSSFEAREYEGSDGKVLLYRLLKPERVAPAKKAPLLIYLHGSGLRGSNNIDQVPEHVEFHLEAAKKYGAFVIVPQCPANARWSFTPSTRPTTQPAGPQSTVPLAELAELIPVLGKEFNLDMDRVYLEGGSMGGFGSWEFLQNRPDLFAAALIMNGGGDPSKAATVAHIPLWLFHGDKDKTVPVERSREMVAAIEQAGGHPKYSEYKGLKHDISAGLAGEQEQILEWLFAQKR